MNEDLINRLWDESANDLRFLNRRAAFAHLVAEECAKIAVNAGASGSAERRILRMASEAIRAAFKP